MNREFILFFFDYFLLIKHYKCTSSLPKKRCEHADIADSERKR